MKPGKIDNPMNFYAPGLMIGGIILGSLIGSSAPTVGGWLGKYVDYAVLALVFLLFFEVRLEILAQTKKHLCFLSIAWIANFVVIPTLGFLIATLFLSDQPLLFTGVLIYFIAPCTDWMLGFTKLADGNVTLGVILVPINMVTQLLLYPVYLWVFASKQVDLPVALFDSILLWFLIPFAGAIFLRMLLKAILSTELFRQVTDRMAAVVPYAIFLVIMLIFSANVLAILEDIGTFVVILIAVFLFFVSTYFIGEKLSMFFRLARPERVLLAMTTAARNAPLMLSVTVIAFPAQPLIYAAIIIGMLVEFPHLAALAHLLRKKDQGS